MTSLPAPKLFISYSWSTPTHEQWVLDLATEVSDSGVEVILDKWDLREGHDKISFMEKMVTDPSITKVLIVCDQTYAAKADGRAGGVGTETQIISREVYEKQSQDKFVAVVAEKDERGLPYLPTYYNSRIFIDLSESDRYAEGFEKLLRWIFDKPLYLKPARGIPPSFLTDTAVPVLGTSALAKRVIDGLRNDKSYVRGALDEYLSRFSSALEAFRILSIEGEQDDRVFRSIEDFIASRNEFLSLLTTLSQYGDSANYGPRLHGFFESLIPYMSSRPEAGQGTENELDNFKFVIHEMFLYALAVLIRGNDFKAAEILLARPYYVPGRSDFGTNATASYIAFREHLASFEAQKRRLASNRTSLLADLLEQRAKTAGMSFEQLMQADFICFFRADLLAKNRYDNWFPETLLHATRRYGPFEVFARAVSQAYFLQLIPLLGVTNLTEIKSQLDKYTVSRDSLPRWQGGQSFSPATLIGFEHLASQA